MNIVSSAEGMADFEERLKTFLAHYDELERNLEKEDGFYKEFMSLKYQSQQYRDNNTYPADTGLLPANKKKNRFKDILPFEHTRVSLHPIEGVEGSDYINANYIAGASDQVTYIAAQGPLPSTVNDFWRMLWYHNIEIVVMACRQVEMAKAKCESYWPELNNTKMFGVIQVTTTYEENVSNDFIIRDLLAECEGEQQQIRQYHYTAWPDHGKPKSSEPIIRMIEILKDHRKRMDVPVVVHCSAGCGRTGTMLAIDIARDMLLSKTIPKDFSVHRIVEKMRQQRPAMVQAKDQYLFVYMAVVELVRRTLANKPQPPPKPDGRKPRSPSPEVITEVRSYTNLDILEEPPTNKAEPDKDVIYQNTDTMEPPLPHRSKSPTDGPTAPARTKHGYMNVQPGETARLAVKTNGQPSTPPKPPKKPSPPTKPRDPVARKPSNGVVLDNGEKDREPAPKENKDEPKYENAPSAKVAPVPKPKPRTKPSDTQQSLNRPVSPQVPTSPARPVSPQQRPLPSIPLTSTPVKKGEEKEKDSQQSLNRPVNPQVPTSPARPVSPQQRPLPSIPLTSTPVKKGEEKEKDSVYSTVDTTQFTDTGPEIKVVDESSGKVAPLAKVEVALETSDQLLSQNTSKTSILDTIMSIVGDIPEDETKEELPLPPPPPPSKPQLDLSDEIPPMIPRRTAASRELVEDTPKVTVELKDEGVPKSNSGKDLSSSAVYESPTLLSKPVAKLEVSKVTALGSSIDSSSLAPPGSQGQGSSSLAQSLATMPRTSHQSTPSHGHPHQKSVRGNLLGFLRKKDKEKKRVTAGDIGTPVGGMVRSASDQDVKAHALPTIAVPGHSPEHVKDEYKFPGEMGYGIRIGKPRGPRPEPPQWKLVPNNILY